MNVLSAKYYLVRTYSTENDLTVFTCVLTQRGGERNSTFFLLVITEGQRNVSSQMLH